MQQQYKYKFSIIMAVYNVEEYIEEAIQSILKQDIGFEESVQLILVDDGSKDKSGEVCQQYAERYPENIVYIKQENGGVSKARNKGMEYVQGKYMNFLDSDDLLDLDVLGRVYDLFEEAYNYIDVVSVPIYFFEGLTGGHQLNYKYKKTRQVNLVRDYNHIQLSSSAAFVKSEFKARYQFDPNMKYAEDALFINKILLEKETMGVLKGSGYRYRRRQSGASAIQVGAKVKEWYNVYLETFSMELIRYAKEIKGYVPRFIQYLIMYDLQWRLQMKKLDASVLDIEEQEAFIDNIRSILQHIDDEIILQQRNLSVAHKLFVLELKNGEGIDSQLRLMESPKNVELMYVENYVYSVTADKVKVDFIDIVDGQLHIEGCLGKTLCHEDYKIYVEIDEEKHLAQTVDRSLNNEESLGHIIKETIGFKAQIPLNNNSKIQSVRIYVQIRESLMRPGMILGKFVRINSEIEGSYFITKTHRVVFMYNAFYLMKNSLKVNVGRELRLCKSLLKKKQSLSVLIRMGYFIYKKLQKKQVWLLMDRVDKADDNAEHLMKYLMSEDDGAKKYYVISKESPDYERMKQYGKVVAYNSKYHKWLQLIADKVISSHIEDSIRVPFQGNARYVRELSNFKYVFLQHGIIKDDLSGWLNKYNKKIDLFITSTPAEYESILEGNYKYTDCVVKLTGLPRYDGLRNQENKQILIMPTWRSKEVSEINPQTGVRAYNDRFKLSDYFKAYNQLINNERLLKVCKEYGYKVVFFPHPAIVQQIKDFDKNEQVIFEDYTQSYQKMFNESSLLITDYSSVAFDFAYLKKPVMYYQFDRDIFFKGHTYSEGYFDYEEMGFGPVYKEEDILIDEIIKQIKANCQIEEKYQDRIETFYKYTDTNNCKRVYEEIKKI